MAALPLLQVPYCEETNLGVRSAEPVMLIDTHSGACPNQKTWLALAWNARELRVLFHCEDERPWATLNRRDAPLYQEEVVEVFLDPYGDLQSYFEIELNPLNTVCDLVLRRTRSGYTKDFSWDCANLETSVELGQGFWRAELAIPLASLGHDLPTQGWRANFYRIDRPTFGASELSAWAPTMRPHFHVSHRFGHLDLVR